MQKKKVKKLALSRETLERLDDQVLAGVQGAVEGRSDSVPQCCTG
jgi:hypothetical protein